MTCFGGNIPDLNLILFCDSGSKNQRNKQNIPTKQTEHSNETNRTLSKRRKKSVCLVLVDLPTGRLDRSIDTTRVYTCGVDDEDDNDDDDNDDGGMCA